MKASSLALSSAKGSGLFMGAKKRISKIMFVEEILGGLPLPDRALWKVTGEDRVRYLNGQVTNDLSLLTPGRSLYGAVLTGKGRMEGEGFFAATEDAVWIDAPLPVRESLRARLEKFLIADDAMIEDVTDSYRLSHWFGEEAPPPRRAGS